MNTEIIIKNISQKPRKNARHQKTIVAEGEHAKIVKGESVTLFGTCEKWDGGKSKRVPYEKHFKMGDSAEYGSYNLIYIGEIVGITEKTISIKPPNERKKCLSLLRFNRMNWNFDLNHCLEENLDTMMYI